ncbi:MAG TPA: amino acid ABC transporter substrate-binding protein [Firmicutes bacterium]|jgi:polar amino acid transport system substrate-binding protein|nr:amino acid ABC transporter substrate-binding protein [Bacillota bacterium]
MNWREVLVLKRNITLVFFAVLIMVLAFSGCKKDDADVDNSWKQVKAKGEFVLGLDDSFPPMGFRDENGEIVGFDIDLAKEVCSRLKIKLVLQPINWSAKEQELNTKNIDCIWNGLTITPEREEVILFTKPYMKNRQVLVVRADSDYAALADFTGKKLGIQAGSSANDALDNAAEFKASLGEVVAFDDNMTALMDLEQGGIDVVLMDEIVARFYIQQRSKNYKVLDEALAGEEYGIGFRKEDWELMEKFEETLIAMAEDGTMAAISQRWFGEDITIIDE